MLLAENICSLFSTCVHRLLYEDINDIKTYWGKKCIFVFMVGSMEK